MEIAFLKERIGNTKDSDDQTMIADSRQLGGIYRNKRPVRLLPPHLLFGERKNETELHKQIIRRRYEQPTNCSDLSILGYTLNGFYTVKSNDSSTKSNSTNNDTKLETVYCAFKQPEGTFNPALVEKRIISRREAIKSGIKRIFHATRKTNWIPNLGLSFISFENVLWYSGDAPHANMELSTETTDMFIAPQSGVYLFIFRGNVTFLNENENREFSIVFVTNYVDLGPGKMKKGKVIGTHTVHRQEKFASIEFDRMTKVNRGDKIQLRALFTEIGAKFSGSSMSFTLFLLNE